MFRLTPVLLALAACGTATSTPASAPPSGYDLPALTGRVVDRASLLNANDETVIDRKLSALEGATGHQVVVATVPNLGGHRIEDYANTLGNYWRIGRTGLNDGVILLVAPTERNVRIEVGKGLDEMLTDPEAGKIIDKNILPAFSRGDFARGIAGGVNGIIDELGPLPENAA